MKKFISTLIAVALVASGITASAQDTTTHTMTGTVVSATNDVLVVDTATGRMTLKLDSTLDRMRYNDLAAGSRIEFSHKLNTDGMTVVTDVRPLTPVGADPNTTVDRTTSSNYDRATTTTTTTTTTSDDVAMLPSTAGPLALLALIGGAALAVGAVWRRKHKSPVKVVQPRA